MPTSAFILHLHSQIYVYPVNKAELKLFKATHASGFQRFSTKKKLRSDISFAMINCSLSPRTHLYTFYGGLCI